MNVYILNTKDIEVIARTLENIIYKQKLKQFEYDKTYTPTKIEIPVELLKKALIDYKV
jgi:hypothetical protein